MDELVLKLFDVIKDYRIEQQLMSPEIIYEWVNQFETEDREFILEETTHIMSNRYISFVTAKELLKKRIDFLANEYNFETPQLFLNEVRIINHQPEGKSQKVLVDILNNICEEFYDFDLESHLNINAKYYIYVDDVLCTGDTLFKGLAKNDENYKGFFHQTNSEGRNNLDIFTENESILLLIFFCLHKKNLFKVIKRFEHGLKKVIPIHYSWNRGLEVDNTLNDDCTYNYFILSESNKSDNVARCEEQIINKLNTSNYYKEESFFYRKDNVPNDEALYSSKNNRERFEKIIAEKSIDIYNGAEGLLEDIRARPLGYGLRLENSLGFGALFFTWRNVAYNTPLIFWYEHHGWQPLFRRNYIRY